MRQPSLPSASRHVRAARRPIVESVLTDVGMVLDDDTDWDEVAELVTESKHRNQQPNGVSPRG